MMHPVARKQLHAAKVNETTAVVEASTIGLLPGEWPFLIAVMESDELTGSGVMLAFESSTEQEARYVHRLTGYVLIVLND